MGSVALRLGSCDRGGTLNVGFGDVDRSRLEAGWRRCRGHLQDSANGAALGVRCRLVRVQLGNSGGEPEDHEQDRDSAGRAMHRATSRDDRTKGP